MKQRGFTIIEVALVLAIAGLIFLVVFLALPALQNSQKDTARKQDVARVVSALQAYEADHQGSLPDPSWDPGYFSDGSSSSGFSGYLGTLSQTKIVDVAGVGWTLFNPQKNELWSFIEVFPATRCLGGSVSFNSSTLDWTTIAASSTSQSDAAVAVLLSSGNIYCVTATD